MIDIKTVDKHNMIFEETNIYLFHSINSLATQFPIIDKIAVFLADDLNTDSDVGSKMENTSSNLC